MKRAIVVLGLAAACQRTAEDRPRLEAYGSYQRIRDHTYLSLEGRDLRMDLDVPRKGERPVPVVLYLHGGGWVKGTKEQVRMDLRPYLAAGWAVVTPDYRLAPADPAPAAVEDAICCLRWVGAHAAEHGFDPHRLVVAGYSAGGHLALMLAMLHDSAGFGQNCPSPATPRPVAVVNFSGITDVRELLEGPTRRDWAVTWIGERTDRGQIATRLSPLTWVRTGVPPVVSVHGDADATVPYGQAEALHRALDSAGVPNLLVTARGAGHAIRDRSEASRVTAAVMAFLRQQGVTPVQP